MFCWWRNRKFWASFPVRFYTLSVVHVVVAKFSGVNLVLECSCHFHKWPNRVWTEWGEAFFLEEWQLCTRVSVQYFSAFCSTSTSNSHSPSFTVFPNLLSDATLLRRLWLASFSLCSNPSPSQRNTMRYSLPCWDHCPPNRISIPTCEVNSLQRHRR